MTQYAGFKDLRDYLTRRCRDRELSLRELSLSLGFTHSYIHAISRGDFQPSRQNLDKISDHFGDHRRIARVLAGLETPPVDFADKTIAQLLDVAQSLPHKGRVELFEYALFLRGKYSQEDHP